MKIKHFIGFRRIKNIRVRTEDIYEPEKVFSQIPYFVGQSPVLHIPIENIVIQGAHKMNSAHHPFLIALNAGVEVLSNFYKKFSPRNIIEMYNIAPQGLTGEGLAPWELPWLLRDRQHPPGEGGLSARHGVSYFGPCSEKKVQLEHGRLVSVMESIKANGYRPDLHSHISGHFLQNDDSFCFFIRGGKHRAAALAYLGYDRIPVRMRESWPRIVYRETAKYWPLVSSGEMDVSLAVEVFDKYFVGQVFDDM